MTVRRTERRRSDSTPWDRVIGLRVGAVAGGLLGALFALVTGIVHVGIIAGPAMIGGLIGWWSQRVRPQP